MLETKYGLKYSMPHSVVHIVDNSMYTGELPTVVVDDPSLYSTIVVSGCPMGTDNQMITIDRSDTAGVAYGLASLSTADIEKYGQTVTYPMALLDQNVPVRFMRVTPNDATFAFSCLLIQWKWDGSKLHVRYRTSAEVYGNDGLPLGKVHSSFKNPERFNKALINAFNSGTETTEDGWTQRVFMSVIAAGRGSAYNKYNYAINPTTQGNHPANIQYIFSTIDTITSQVVEKFNASLINQNNGNRPDAIDSVNVVVGKRVKGTSILVPFVNEAAIKELYTEYMSRVKEMYDTGIQPDDYTSLDFVNTVYKTLNINTFDPIYGSYIYNGDTGVMLPYLQIDMFNLEIPKLDPANRLKAFLDDTQSADDYLESPIVLNDKLTTAAYGIGCREDEKYHVGDVFFNNNGTLALSLITTINQYTGSVTSIPITQLWKNPDDRGSDENRASKIDYFRGMVYAANSGDDATTKENVANAVNDLIARKKLIPRVDTDSTFKKDFIIVQNTEQNTQTADGLNTFYIAYVPYVTGASGVVADSTNIEIFDTAAEIYPRFAYPTTKITSFATSPSDIYFTNAGTTVIVTTADQGYPSGLDALGTVYVNGYETKGDYQMQYYKVENDKAFVVGKVPSSVSTVDLLNTAYDVLLYQDQDNPDPSGSQTRVTWTVVNGSVDAEGTNYAVGDVVSFTDTTIPGKFIVTGVDGGKVTSIAIDTVASSNTIIEPGTKSTTTTAYTYTLLTASEAPEGWGTADTYYTLADGKYTVVTFTGEGATLSPAYAADTYYTRASAGRSPSGLTITLTSNDIVVQEDPKGSDPETIKRYIIAGTIGSLYRYAQDTGVIIPNNYYSDTYGLNPNSELGGIAVEHGYTGFFDDNISDIEFKWRYSELLVQAYKGEIDPRIMSPTRCPAKFLFDGGTNTIVGQTILPYMVYKPVDIINASTIFTDDEKEAIVLNSDLVSNIKEFADIDVKQAMYDLMVYRCYYNMPEDKRPIGPGFGLSLHLDSGVTDANTAMLLNQSFAKRFTNPNASWDIGGYVSSADGLSYTYAQRLVSNLFNWIHNTSINRPYVGDATNITPQEYSAFFPDIDTADWELRELLYNSGGNAWIMDINGNLQRKYQRTLSRGDSTSDLIQESNMRTLSQLCYLLQNKIDSYLLAYNDDGVLKTLKDEIDNMFSNWVGNLVQALDITFMRDRNPLDGGEIVVCYVNVTFRGLVLRVPIIVNVQARQISNS